MVLCPFDTKGKIVELNVTTRGHLIVENTLENSVHLGRRFFNSSWQSMDIDAVLRFYLDIADGYNLHSEFVFEADVGHSIDVYMRSTVDAVGDTLSVFNHNGNFQDSNTFASKLYKNSTFSDLGTLAMQYRIGSEKKATGTRYDSGEFVLVPASKVAIVITNLGTAGCVSWDFGFSQIEV